LLNPASSASSSAAGASPRDELVGAIYGALRDKEGAGAATLVTEPDG
jgi:hypothetical protein